MAHTPGPWKIIGNPKPNQFIVQGADQTYAGIIMVAMTEEDVRLAVAAPDMYEALTDILDDLPFGEKRLRVTRALVKARGGETE